MFSHHGPGWLSESLKVLLYPATPDDFFYIASLYVSCFFNLLLIQTIAFRRNSVPVGWPTQSFPLDPPVKWDKRGDKSRKLRLEIIRLSRVCRRDNAM